MSIFPSQSKLIEDLSNSRRNCFIACDFSPPKLDNPQGLKLATSLNPDMFSVSYNPGQSVKLNPIFASFWIQNETKISSIFTLATGNMNPKCLEKLLLNAHVLGLTNAVFVMGDSSSKTISATKALELTARMNFGLDVGNNQLDIPTNFCIGSTIDISKNWDHEISLTKKKIDSGAEFFLAQAQFDISKVVQFLESYRDKIGAHIEIPILWGVQMITKGSSSFTSIPDYMKRDLDLGRSGLDIALEIFDQYFAYGIDSFYLLPPFFRTGKRDYDLAEELISALTSN